MFQSWDQDLIVRSFDLLFREFIISCGRLLHNMVKLGNRLPVHRPRVATPPATLAQRGRTGYWQSRHGSMESPPGFSRNRQQTLSPISLCLPFSSLDLSPPSTYLKNPDFSQFPSPRQIKGTDPERTGDGAHEHRTIARKPGQPARVECLLRPDLVAFGQFLRGNKMTGAGPPNRSPPGHAAG